jgi:cellobiose phosphorylase
LGWDGFTAARMFRGVNYQIEVRRKGRGSKITLTVDGQPVEGTLIPSPSGNQVTVKVTIG